MLKFFLLLVCSTFITKNVAAAEYFLENRLMQELKVIVEICEDEDRFPYPRTCQNPLEVTIPSGKVFNGKFNIRAGFLSRIGGIYGISGNRRAIFGDFCESLVRHRGQQAILIFEPFTNDSIICKSASL